MRKDFVISNSIALEGKDYYYDLHNCYSVKEIKFENESHVSKFVFEKAQGDWISVNNPKTIEIIFIGVSYLETNNNFFKNLPEDIEEIGYKNEGDFDYDWLLNEEQSTSQNHFVLRFVNDDYVRIFADEIKVVISL